MNVNFNNMKILILIMIFSISFTGFSQTKAETEKWIISKFDKWKVDYSFKDSFNHYWINVPTSLEIKDCKLIYKETEFTSQSISHQDKKIFEIEMGDIININWINNRLVFKSRKKNIIITKSQSRNGFGDLAAINFEIDAEKDLDKRLLKAFEHLKSFCKPTKDAKEPF